MRIPGLSDVDFDGVRRLFLGHRREEDETADDDDDYNDEHNQSRHGVPLEKT
jgi:hypothetical protein